jgi:hypothetical protein
MGDYSLAAQSPPPPLQRQTSTVAAPLLPRPDTMPSSLRGWSRVQYLLNCKAASPNLYFNYL